LIATKFVLLSSSGDKLYGCVDFLVGGF